MVSSMQLWPQSTRDTGGKRSDPPLAQIFLQVILPIDVQQIGVAAMAD